jgi:hypothetical protein
MFKLKYLFFLLLTFAFISEAAIQNYHPVFASAIDTKGDQLVAIRNYQLDHTNYFLTVNPNNLQTTIIPANQLTLNSVNLNKLSATPYFKLLKKYSQPPYKLQNYGHTHALHPVTGIFLTVDLCPSTKPFEKELFTSIQGPIAIAISGRWLLQHPDEFNWLIAQKNIRITWVNHSFTHPYQPNIPLAKNFLLSDPGNFDYEVLATEELLIANNQTPSIYFRFPGLVANKQLIKKLNKLGLVPLGADAWLAKNEKAQNGSIILVHGNGNEHLGVTMLFKLITEKNIQLLPIEQAT